MAAPVSGRASDALNPTPAAIPARAAHRRDFGRAELGFMIGVPILWAALLLLHPSGDGTQLYRDLQDNVVPMLVVHVGTMLFIPAMAAAVYLLLRGVEGAAARVSRIALVPFVVFYSGWEVLQGIATGLLANEVNGLPAADRAIGASLLQDFAEHRLIGGFGVLGSIGSTAFIVAMIAAGVALHRHAGASRAVAALLGVAGFLITMHPPPFGPTGLAMFAVAVVIYVQPRRS